MPREPQQKRIAGLPGRLVRATILAALGAGASFFCDIVQAQPAGEIPGAAAPGKSAPTRNNLAPEAHGGQDRPNSLHKTIDELAARVMPKVIASRRDFHQHPELGHHEQRTSRIIAQQLGGLGLEVRTGVANTGVLGILRGGKPGPVVALRADMDALPVTEEGDLSFKSTTRTQYKGREVGVMHACGHDAHMAILLGAAEILATMKADLSGTVVFLFQPDEEGTSDRLVTGAELMVQEGVLANPKVDAIFGLHVYPFESGGIRFRPRGIMAASDLLLIRVRGRQTHGALPWDGVDPIVVASQIVLGLQTVISRQANLTTAPAVLTLGKIEGGVRSNIIPDEVNMEGIIRTFDPAMQKDIHERVKRTVTNIAHAAGATAEVTIRSDCPLTFNDPQLAARMTPTLKRVSAGEFDSSASPLTIAEDFAFYQKHIPGLFFLLGVTPKGAAPSTVAPNHSPRFFIDENALITGVRAMASLAVDFLQKGPGTPD